MDLKLYEDFIPYSEEYIDTQITLLEDELNERVGVLNIKRENGKLKVKSHYFKKLAKLKKLLKLLFFKKKKLKARGANTAKVDKRIDNIKKRIK